MYLQVDSEGARVDDQDWDCLCCILTSGVPTYRIPHSTLLGEDLPVTG